MKFIKKLVIIIPIAFLLVLTSHHVSALDVSYDVMPHDGPASTPIFIWVRCDPLYVGDTSWIYVFWDNVPIKGQQRIVSPVSGSLFKWGWDITFTPPEGYNFRGDHRIKIWIEQPGGEKKELNWEYTILDGMPEPDWFKTLPPEFINEIRGPEGEKGDAGAKGNAGSRGNKGEKGNRGQAGLDGGVGPVGPIGPKGDIGDKGETGSSGNLIYVVIVMNLITLGLVINLYRRNES